MARCFELQGPADVLRIVRATRYVTPLREGGSLPAIVEADDEGTYVLKFRGAGQGRKALVAELVAGEVGRLLGLRVPELVLVDLDPEMGRSEPDPEIQDLLRASAGLNLALDYLPGSLGFDPVVEAPDPLLASRILWFDALVTNVDRTPRNTNLLVWHGKLWLIDHGAALYFHHDWPATDEELRARARRPFAAAHVHVLLPYANRLEEVDREFASLLTPERLQAVVDLVPNEWLEGERGFEGPEEVRAAYLAFFAARLEGRRPWVEALMALVAT